jgi:hypothetical protein
MKSKSVRADMEAKAHEAGQFVWGHPSDNPPTAAFLAEVIHFRCRGHSVGTPI